MESRRRGRSFSEDLPDSSSCEEDDNQGGPEMYDPSLVFDYDESTENENQLNELEGGTECGGNEDSDSISLEDEEAYYTRGRSRSRSVHCNDDIDRKMKGLTEEELKAQIEQSAKNHEKESLKPAVVRTGALKQREVQALQMGLEEATHHAKEEERLEEQAEREAAEREKEERSVSISNSSGRSSLHLSTELGKDPPMRRVKILLLGDSSVGKSSVIHRLTDNSFKQSMVSTVGVDYKVRKMHINGENIQVQLWDTAGSEKFHKITQSYYRGVHGIMLVFDVSNKKSFKHVSYWLSNISKYANEHVQVQLVGNKVDLRPETKKDLTTSTINKFMKRKSGVEKSDATETEEEQDPFVQTYEGNAVASKYQIKYSETSALNNTNIEESLIQCVKQVIYHMDNPNLMRSLREKFQKRDSKPRPNSKDNIKSTTSSNEKQGLGNQNIEKSDSRKGKGSGKDKDCVIS